MATSVKDLGVKFNSSKTTTEALKNTSTNEGKGTIHFTTDGDIVLNGTKFTKNTKTDIGLGNVTNNAQVKGLSSGTTQDHIVTWGADGYTVKDSGYTIATSVPSGAVFTDTDTKVTSVANHYSPSADTNSKLTASGATGSTSGTIQFVTGLNRDSKGHVTGVVSGAITVPTTLPASNTTDSYSSTGSSPVSGKAVADALGTLYVTGASGIAASKTISAWSETDGRVSITTQDISISEAQVSGLTSDLGSKAPLNSPALTGTPTAPTADAGTNTTQIATTAFVKTAVDTAVSGASNYLGTIAAVGNLSTKAKKGDFYRVSTAWSGVHVGDILIAEQDNPAAAVITSGTNGYTCLHNELNTDTHLTYALTIKDNDGTAATTFDQASAKSIQFKAGNGITVAKTADGEITITNSKPDVNHNTDRYVNSAKFEHDSTNHNIKMTLTRAGSDTATVTGNIPVMTGATSSDAGNAGVVPCSAAGDQDKVLSAGGAWVNRTEVIYLNPIVTNVNYQLSGLSNDSLITGTYFDPRIKDVVVTTGALNNPSYYLSWSGKSYYQNSNKLIVCNGDFWRWNGEEFVCVAMTSPVANLVWD